MFNNMLNASMYLLNMQLVNMPVLNSIFNYDVTKVLHNTLAMLETMVHMCLYNTYVPM